MPRTFPPPSTSELLRQLLVRTGTPDELRRFISLTWGDRRRTLILNALPDRSAPGCCFFSQLVAALARHRAQEEFIVAWASERTGWIDSIIEVGIACSISARGLGRLHHIARGADREDTTARREKADAADGEVLVDRGDNTPRSDSVPTMPRSCCSRAPPLCPCARRCALTRLFCNHVVVLVLSLSLAVNLCNAL